VNGNPDIWSHFFVGNISLNVGVLVESGWLWEGNLRSVRDERLLGSVPVNSVDHGVGKSVNLGIDVLLGDVSSVSLSLVKRWSWRESDLGSVWNEWLLRSVPVDSVNHGVGKTVDFGVDVLLRDISTVSSSLVEGWSWWESNLRSIWDEWLLGSVPVDSVDHGVSETVNLSIDVLLRDISAVSLSLIESWGSSCWESNLRSIWDESVLTSWPWESFDMLVSEILNIFIDAFLANISVESLIKSWWGLKSNFTTVWDKSIFRSWPWKSFNVFISKVLYVLIDSFFADVSGVFDVLD